MPKGVQINLLKKEKTMNDITFFNRCTFHN